MFGGDGGGMFDSFLQIDANRARDTSQYFIDRKNSDKQYSNTKSLARMNKKHSMWMARNYPSAQVEGLRAAGLNPMLAISKGMAAPPSVASGSAQQQKTDLKGDVNFAQNRVHHASARLLEQQAKTEKQRSRSEKYKADMAEPAANLVTGVKLGSGGTKAGQFLNDAVKGAESYYDKYQKFESKADQYIYDTYKAIQNKLTSGKPARNQKRRQKRYK